MEPAKKLKANLKLQGQPCAQCSKELALGEDVAICNGCQSSHHAACWDAAGGCASAGCANAPLTRLPPEAQAAGYALPPGYKRCHACLQNINQHEELCIYCNAIVTPDGLYHGPKENAPGAVGSLVYGIVGLFVCGLIFGIVAILKANNARTLIAGNPRYRGSGLAIAGLVMGIIDLVAWSIILLARLGG